MDIEAIESVFGTLDITYIVLCNIITYLVIQTIESIKGSTIKKGWKRAVSAISALGLAFLMWIALKHDGEALFYGFFIQFLTWDYLFKGWLNKLQNTFGNDEPSELVSGRNFSSK